MSRTQVTGIAIGLTALIGVAQPASAQQPSSDSLRVAVNRVFATWTATDGPGCAVGVSQDGRVVLENGYGMANLELDAPITPASIFHVASVSKQFTAAAVMLLARDGKPSLEDDIRKYLPELPDYGHRITIRHLLTHTSGLRDQWDHTYGATSLFTTVGDLLTWAANFQEPRVGDGTTYTITATDSTLVLKTRWGTERTVRPAYGQTFGGDFLLSFTQGTRGQINGMRMSSGRVRGVRFERVPR